MQTQTITRALRALRVQIVHNRLDGLEHVEALLKMRGDNLPPVPRKLRRPFRRMDVQRAIFAMLREGPTTTQAIAQRLMEQGGIGRFTAVETARNALHRLKRKGVVVRNEGAWCLATAPLTSRT